MPTPSPEIPPLTPANLTDAPLTEENCERLANGEPLAYSEAICGRDGHGCTNYECPLMPIPERLESLRCMLEIEAHEEADGLSRLPVLTFTFPDHATLSAQPARARKPSEWRLLSEKYEFLGLGMCASICEAKRIEERRRRKRRREKREAEQIRKDTMDDMFPNGMDDGFTGVKSND